MIVSVLLVSALIVSVREIVIVSYEMAYYWVGVESNECLIVL